MDGLSPKDKEVFINQMQVEVRQTLSRVFDAVYAAPDGQWINASEIPVRDAMDDLKRKVYEKAVQTRVDSKESAFSPSKGDVWPRGIPSGSEGKP